MKSKTESHWNFLTRWVIGHGLVGFVIWTGWFLLTPSFSWFTQWGVAALMGVLFAVAQFFVLPKRWISSAKQWLIGSSMAWLIGAYIFTSLIYDYNVTNLFTLLAAYVLPTALAQAWMLNKRFKQAWLWVGAILAGSLVDASLSTTFNFADISSQISAQTIIPALQAIISGSILIYMSQAFDRRENNRSYDKSDDERLSRLQDGSHFVYGDSYRQESESKKSASM